MAFVNFISFRSTSLTRIVIAIGLGAITGGMAPRQNMPSREYQIKAAFLYNFTQFIEWPPHVFPTSDSPFVIGILGVDPFSSYLDEIVRGENVKGHPLVVQRFEHVNQIEACHLLFVNMKTGQDVEKVLSSLKLKNIVTVGEYPDFASKGGLIQFVNERNKVRFRINLQAAEAENIQISSKLLRLAEII